MEIPHKLHNAIIGAKGRLLRSIIDECGGIMIKFPPGGSNSDKITLKGPKDDVEKAKHELLELAKEKVWCCRLCNIYDNVCMEIYEFGPKCNDEL